MPLLPTERLIETIAATISRRIRPIQIVANPIMRPFIMPGIWQVALTSEPEANAWDVELRGPNKFYWSRRFSGGDRDADVISEAVRSAVLDQAA